MRRCAAAAVLHSTGSGGALLQPWRCHTGGAQAGPGSTDVPPHRATPADAPPRKITGVVHPSRRAPVGQRGAQPSKPTHPVPRPHRKKLSACAQLLRDHMVRAPALPPPLNRDRNSKPYIALSFAEAFGTATQAAVVKAISQASSHHIRVAAETFFDQSHKWAFQVGSSKRWDMRIIRSFFGSLGETGGCYCVRVAWDALPEAVRYSWWVLEAYLYSTFPLTTTHWEGLLRDTPERHRPQLMHPRVVSALLHAIPTDGTPADLAVSEAMRRDTIAAYLKHLEGLPGADKQEKAEHALTWQAHASILRHLSTSGRRAAFANTVKRLLVAQEGRGEDTEWCTHLCPEGFECPTELASVVLWFCERNRNVNLAALFINVLHQRNPTRFLELAGFINHRLRGLAECLGTVNRAEGAVHLAAFADTLSLPTLVSLSKAVSSRTHYSDVRANLVAWVKIHPVKQILEEGLQHAVSNGSSMLLEVLIMRLVSLSRVEEAMAILLRTVKTESSRQLVSPTAATYAAVLGAIRFTPLEEAQRLYDLSLMLPHLPSSPETCKALMNARVHLYRTLLKGASESPDAVSFCEGITPLLLGRTAQSVPDPVGASGAPRAPPVGKLYLAGMLLSSMYSQVEGYRGTEDSLGLLEQTFDYLESDLGIGGSREDLQLLKGLPHFAGCKVSSDLTREFFRRVDAAKEANRRTHPCVGAFRSLSSSLQLHLGIQTAERVVVLDIDTAKRLIEERDVFPSVKRGYKVLVPFSTLLQLFGETESATQHKYLSHGTTVHHDGLRKIAEAFESQPDDFIALSLVGEITLLCSSLWGNIEAQDNIAWAAGVPGNDTKMLPAVSSVAGFLGGGQAEAGAAGQPPGMYSEPSEGVRLSPEMVDPVSLQPRPEPIVFGKIPEVLFAACAPFARKTREILFPEDPSRKRLKEFSDIMKCHGKIRVISIDDVALTAFTDQALLMDHAGADEALKHTADATTLGSTFL